MANRHLSPLQSDRASAQYKSFVSQASETQLAKFSRSKSRLDHFFAGHLKGKEEFKDLWEAVKILLLFSHGNAFVESGFSINKEMLVENLHEETLIALRRACDGVQDAGGEHAIVVDQEMVRYARGASSKYKEALEMKRKKESELEKLSRYEREENKRKKEKLEDFEKQKKELEVKQRELESKIKKLRKK